MVFLVRKGYSKMNRKTGREERLRNEQLKAAEKVKGKTLCARDWPGLEKVKGQESNKGDV